MTQKTQWNYRLVKYADGSGFGVHEVYYENDKQIGMTETPETLRGKGRKRLKKNIAMMLADVMRQPVLDELQAWAVLEIKPE